MVQAESAYMTSPKSKLGAEVLNELPWLTELHTCWHQLIAGVIKCILCDFPGKRLWNLVTGFLHTFLLGIFPWLIVFGILSL
jgi:hypothetical protein